MVCFPFPDLTRLDDVDEKERVYLAIIGALMERYPEGVEIGQAEIARRLKEPVARFLVARMPSESFQFNQRRMPVAKPAGEVLIMSIRDFAKKTLTILAALASYTATTVDDAFVATATKFVTNDLLWSLLESVISSGTLAGASSDAVLAHLKNHPELVAACAQHGIPVEAVPAVVAFRCGLSA